LSQEEEEEEENVMEDDMLPEDMLLEVWDVERNPVVKEGEDAKVN
jgi:hypothetical protein